MHRLKPGMSIILSYLIIHTSLLLPIPKSYAIAPQTLLKMAHLQVKTSDDKLLAKIIEAKLLLHALLLYHLQIEQGLSGESLKIVFSSHYANQGQGIIPEETDTVASFDWEDFEPGYFPFKFNRQKLAISIFRKGERPYVGLARTLVEGEFENGLQFLVVNPFDERDFLRNVIDPKASQKQIVSELEWLLGESSSLRKDEIVRRAFKLIQALSYMRTATFYRELKEESKKRLIKILSAQTMGRLLFGMLIENRDEAIQEARINARRQGGKIRRDARKLRVKATEMRAKPDEEILATLRYELETRRQELAPDIKSLDRILKLDDKGLLGELRKSKVVEMKGQARVIVTEISDPQYVRKTLERKLQEMAEGLEEGAVLPVSLEDLTNGIKRELLTKRQRAEQLFNEIKRLEEFKTLDDSEALKGIVQPYRDEWSHVLADMRRELENIRARLRSLSTADGRASEVKQYREKEEAQAKRLETQAEQMEARAKAVTETLPDDDAMLQATAPRMQAALQFVEKVLTQEADFKADGIQQTATRDPTSFEKYKGIQKVLAAATQLYVLEQQGFVRDVTLRAARREVGQLIGVAEAVDAGISKLLERGKPKFLFVNTTDYQRADAVSGLALRLLHDEGIPSSLRSKKILKVDLSEFPGEIAQFQRALFDIFNSAEAAANIILVIDFNQALTLFHQNHETLQVVLNNILAAIGQYQGSVIGWISPENRQIFNPPEKFAHLFQKTAIPVELNASDFEEILRIELADIEQHNQIQFPPETLDKAMLALFTDARDPVSFTVLEELIRRLKAVAARAQLDGDKKIALGIVEIAMKVFVDERRKATKGAKGQAKGRADYDQELKDRDFPEEVREVIERESSRLKQLPKESPEAGYIRNYLNWLLSLPWDQSSQEVRDIKRVRQVLDEDHYGLEKAKAQIIEHVGVFIRTGKSKGGILLLHGPPGVGKTSIGKSIARALGREFVRFSVGGMRDEAEIRGHRRTYVGAMPGRLVKALRDAGTHNPVIMIDEVDKIGHDFRGDPADAFLEVLDPEQNHSFRDHYVEVGFDLSKVLFILTANDASKIPGPLRDRMFPIDLEGYTAEEKVKIAKQFLLPKVLKEHEMTPKEFVLQDDDVIHFVIDEFTREAGVRQLERLLTKLVRASIVEMQRDKTSQVRIDRSKVNEYLGDPGISRERKLEEDEVGVVAGLAWSEAGGSLLFCESIIYALGVETQALVYEVTGHLQDVMKESVKVAWGVVMQKQAQIGIDASRFLGQKVQIHFPAGAVPKDGPSAGVTITTALVSLLTGLPVDRNVAMTGEVTLKGHVRQIGGLKNKLLAAYAAGIRKVIIPKSNESDLKDLPGEILKYMEIVLASRVEEVWEAAIPGFSEYLAKVRERKGEGHTKIRRGDPDLTEEERKGLQERLMFVPYRVMSRDSTFYGDMYRTLLSDLERVDQQGMISNLHRELEQRFVIRVVEGEIGAKLDFAVPGKKVYAYSEGNIIYVTAKLVNKLKKYPVLFAALIQHELYEGLGQRHQDAERAEFIFGKLGPSLSTLDLALAAMDAVEEGQIMEPSEFLRVSGFIWQVQDLDQAKELVDSMFAEALKERQVEELAREVLEYYARTSTQDSITLRTGVYVEQQGNPLDVRVEYREVPAEILESVRKLSKLGVQSVRLTQSTLEAYRNGAREVVADMNSSGQLVLEARVSPEQVQRALEASPVAPFDRGKPIFGAAAFFDRAA